MDVEGGGQDADAAKISETNSPASDSTDPYDVDPDVAAYAAGNDPELAHRYQGRPDSPNSWNAYFSRPRDPGDALSHAEPANERPEAPEPGRTTESLDLWGDIEPDAARYADLDRIANPGGSASSRNDPTPDRATDAHATHPDQAARAEAEPERALVLEQRVSIVESENAILKAENADSKQQISTLKNEVAAATQQAAEALAENAYLRQEIADNKASSDAQIADLTQQLADREQQFADYRASNDAKYAAIMRQVEKMNATIEQMQSGREHQPDGTVARERTDETPAASPDQPETRDAVTGEHLKAVAEHKDSKQAADTDEARHHGWRRVVSSASLGFASTAVSTVDTVSQFAMHPGWEGAPGLGATALGLASVGMAQVEKHRRKGKA